MRRHGEASILSGARITQTGNRSFDENSIGSKEAYMIKHCPYHHRMLAHNAEMVDRLGIASPIKYSSVKEEHLATRGAVGVFDVYYQVEIEIVGPEATLLLDLLCVNNIGGMSDGTVIYTSLCNDTGGIIDDLTALRFNRERYWLCPTPARVTAVMQQIEKHIAGRRAWAINLGYKNAYLSIQGPRSRDLLRKLTDVDISDNALLYFHFTIGKVAGVPEVVLSRTGFSGELGFELFYPSEYAEHVWDAVFAAGEEFGVKPCGLGALRTLRIEKRFPIFGLDLDESTSPLEAGLGWTVKFDKGEFVGRAAMLDQKKQGVLRRLVLLEVDGFDTELANGDKIDCGSAGTTVIRSVDQGHAVGKTLAMAYLPTLAAVEGNTVSLESAKGRTFSGRVRLGAAYDAMRERVRS
jgi:aminomethyltransferase